MGYIKISNLRYEPNDILEYMHKWGDDLDNALKSLGIQSRCVKFNTYTNVTSSVCIENDMPEWVSTIRNGTYLGQTSTQVGASYCVACVYFIADNVKYAVFLGIYGDKNPTIEMCGMVDESGGTTLKFRHTGYGMNGTIGNANSADYMTIGFGDGGFHMAFKRSGLSTSYYMYVGHCRTSYDNSVYVPVFEMLNKRPVHANMGSTLVKGSLSESYIAGAINPTSGDIPTGKYYAFDVFLGISQGTIFGTLNNVFTIPYSNGSYFGDIFTSGGEAYFHIGNTALSNNYPLKARV